MTLEEKEAALKKLYAELDQVKDLPLAKNATHTVPGEGYANADIMFIGEAPGKKEDELGRPFVGASGKLLDQMIESISLTRELVYIANLIKHRPPDNRDPLPEEIAVYTPWLEKQIDIIQPKLFVTLGRFSMQYFLGQMLSISQVHGQPKRHNGRIVMPMYHPAAALYRGDLRPVLAADFAKIPKILELINQDKAGTEEGDIIMEEENQKELL